jgi:acetoin utilization protein AcuB
MNLNLPVEEFTTPNPITASEDTGIEELKSIMSAEGIRHIPILRGSAVVGIVSERDIRVVSALALNEKRLVTAGDLMSPDPVTVDAETSLDEVAFQMSSLKIGSVVVNEGNKLLGIFTVTDALNALIEISRSTKGQG